ncbi:hypothetical protein G7K_3246-t1 [Saitoella complicata NRRL Y-17804]|uniref:Uncharacterized protein n=1 Tax=Saitoella complicata (strain BCRC 22490 / CBS 7301 / JCM 7358 / NBRC 10748 / NRRL Y-17804) TaxID=698492 RepID=A0A0E9NH01_SAICN|nr:hypothetical protein G7K_3246-t1 [Saitoella complicata NRRL Y-17804]
MRTLKYEIGRVTDPEKLRTSSRRLQVYAVVAARRRYDADRQQVQQDFAPYLPQSATNRQRSMLRASLPTTVTIYATIHTGNPFHCRLIHSHIGLSTVNLPLTLTTNFASPPHLSDTTNANDISGVRCPRRKPEIGNTIFAISLHYELNEPFRKTTTMHNHTRQTSARGTLPALDHIAFPGSTNVNESIHGTGRDSTQIVSPASCAIFRPIIEIVGSALGPPL